MDRSDNIEHISLNKYIFENKIKEGMLNLSGMTTSSQIFHAIQFVIKIFPILSNTVYAPDVNRVTTKERNTSDEN